MPRFRNFRIWRGRLPHWRAEGEIYYVTFRHRRPLAPDERRRLLGKLLRLENSVWNLIAACVLPDATEMLFRMARSADGETPEFSEALEKAKASVGRRIAKGAGERFSPFFSESYDRIVRDEEEFEARLDALLGSPVAAGLVEEPEQYDSLFVADAREVFRSGEGGTRGTDRVQ